MITENTLRTRIEVADDGRVTATLEGVAQSVDKIDKAQQGQADSAAAAATSGQANAESTRAVGESAAQAETRIKAMVQASLQRQQAEQAQITSSMRSVDATKVVNQTLNDQVAAHQRALAAAEAYRERSAAASKAAGNTAGIDEQREALHKLLGEIDPTISALDKLDKQQAKLGSFKKAGLLSDDDFARFNQAIDGGRTRINAAGEAMSHFSLNTSLARRELGYMAKDLATGNFGRFQQSALTLASTSGLMAAAFTPLGLAIGAVVATVGAFGLAAIKGEEDSERLRVSVIATGDAAGVGAMQYDGMASSVGAATGKWGDSRQALEQFAASGQVAGAGLGMLGKQAVDMSTVTGESIDKSVAKILELGQRPADTIAKLNDQYHFLTAAQYAQIAALEAEGNTRAAARLANELDATAMAARAKDVEDNANWMVKSAHFVAAEWGKAWSAMKGESGNGALADQAAALEAQIDRLTTLQTKGVKFDPNSGRSLKEMIGTTSQSLDAIRHQQAQSAFDANARQLDSQANTDAIAAQRRLSAFASPSDKRDSDLKRANADRLAAMYGVVDPAARARIQAEYENQVKTANNNYAAAVKRLAGPKSPETNAYATFQSQVNALDVKAIVGDDAALTQYQQGIAKLADQMGVYISKGGAAAKAAELFNRGQQALQKTLDANHRRELDAQNEYAAALTKANDALQLQVNNEIARIGMGDREYRQTQQVAQAYRDEADALAQLALKRQQGVDGKQGGISQDQYEADVRALQQATASKVQIMQDGYAEMDIAQGDWKNGAVAALQDYADAAADVAGKTRSAFASALGGITDNLADFFVDGKADWSNFANDILKQIVKIQIAKGVASIAGGAADGLGFSFMAKGGVYDSPSLSQYSGGVYDSPQLFKFASGAGVFGEAGPEAIMPLSRGSDGKLGVRAAGGGGGGIEVVVNITNNGQAVQSQQTGARMDGQKLIIDMVLQAVQSDIAKGGDTAKVMQQRFGLQRRGVPVGG